MPRRLTPRDFPLVQPDGPDREVRVFLNWPSWRKLRLEALHRGVSLGGLIEDLAADLPERPLSEVAQASPH